MKCYPRGYWYSGLIGDMDDDHIRNTVTMLRRHLAGDLTSGHHYPDVQRLVESEPVWTRDKVAEMEAEQLRRCGFVGGNVTGDRIPFAKDGEPIAGSPLACGIRPDLRVRRRYPASAALAISFDIAPEPTTTKQETRAMSENEVMELVEILMTKDPEGWKGKHEGRCWKHRNGVRVWVGSVSKIERPAEIRLSWRNRRRLRRLCRQLALTIAGAALRKAIS